MHKRIRLTLTAVCALAAAIQSAAQRSTDPATDAIASATDKLGAATLKSIKFTGFGASFSVGQSPSPREPWPRVTVKSYEATIDYETGSMRVEMVRTQGPVQPRGGGQPFTGEQRVMQLVSGDTAWDVPVPQPAGRQGGPPAAPQAPPAQAPPVPTPLPPQPQPAAATERMLQIWLTPHGFLKAAASHQATTRRVAGGSEVSFALGKHRVTGFVNAKNQIERVQTSIESPVLGDMPFEVIYRDYETAAGVSFPMHILQQQGGFRSLELWISTVTPNAGADITMPDSVKGAALPPITVDAKTIAEGVHYLTGGTHHSVAVEMRDHLVLIEAPLDEARSLAVIGKLKDVVPNKPVRFVINTHHHFDHSGGLRTYVDEGATIVTHEINREYYTKAWSAARTLNPDRLSASGKGAVFQTFSDSHRITDGSRVIEVYRIANSPHDDGFAMVYLPGEKILVEADAFTPAVPPAANAPAPGPAPAGPPGPPPGLSPTTVNLYENIQRLKLDVRQIAALHGPGLATIRDLARAAGRP